MENKFAETERKYREIFQAYRQGALQSEEFVQALETLRIQDGQQQWWQIQGNGQ